MLRWFREAGRLERKTRWRFAKRPDREKRRSPPGYRIGGAIMPLVKRDFSCENAVEKAPGGGTPWSLAASSGGLRHPVDRASRGVVAGVSRSGCGCFRRR